MTQKTNQQPANQTTNPTLNLYVHDDQTDRRNRRIALVLAVAFHVGLLAVQLPNRTAEAAEPEKQEVLTVLQQVRFEKPPPPPQERPKPKAMKIPIPDPTPDEPEPLRQAEELETVLDIDSDEIFVDFPSEPPPAAPNTPLRAGGEVDKPVRTYYVAPHYTEIARRARIQGTVIIDATIDKAGNVIDAQILRGLPMGLDQSALAAVKQWKFEPATLNGKPVPVYYTVTATFELQ
jgi:protein TonB